MLGWEKRRSPRYDTENLSNDINVLFDLVYDLYEKWKLLGITLTTIEGKELEIMTALTDLQAQVTQNTSVEGSAVQLIQGLAAQIAAALAASDTTSLQQLTQQLNASATALAAAITANTPAAPTANTVAAANTSANVVAQTAPVASAQTVPTTNVASSN